MLMGCSRRSFVVVVRPCDVSLLIHEVSIACQMLRGRPGCWPRSLDWKEEFSPTSGCSEYQQKIVSYLYQKLVRYTDLNVPHAVRLDHAPAGVPGEAAHPLLAKLATDEGREPFAILIEREESSANSEAELASYESPAAAYLQLLRRFDNRMLDVATHLLISRSWCYRRFNQALNLEKLQWPLAKEAFSTVEGLEPSPWQKFRAIHVRRQLELDIDVPMLI